ncbi:hypothetical protein DIPPA_25992 [Diplonema papillatum]|nr:hypothetical protein DIPPA_25992 [Diplonema papillatum]
MARAALVAAAWLAAGAAAYDPIGKVIFFGEDGLYETTNDGSNLRLILAHDRMSDAGELYPPAVGGLCADSVLGVIGWTENISPNNIPQHRVLVTDFDGTSTAVQVAKRTGELLGCFIDRVTQTLYFTEFDASNSGMKTNQIELVGPPWEALGNVRQGDGTLTEGHNGGGLTFYDDELFETASSNTRSHPGVFNGKFRLLSQSAAFTGWAGYVGYIAAQKDGSAIVVDSQMPNEKDRTTNLISVDLSNSDPHTIVWEDSPVCPHIGYAASEMACLQPSISATDTPGLLLYLGGSPANTIGYIDLTTNTTTDVYRGTANQVGKTGIGPIMFVEPGLTPIPTTMIPATHAPPTPIPPTSAPPTHPPETGIPPTSIPPTHPPETKAPRTYVPTEAPLDCSIYLTPPKCKSITRLCEWNFDARLCVLFGSRCLSNDEQACVEVANCFWKDGECTPADDCASQPQPDCIALSQCVWTNEIDGCTMAHTAVEPGPSARANLVLVIVLLASGVGVCAVCLSVFVYRMRKSAEKAAAIESERRRAVFADEEDSLKNHTPTNAEKIRRVGDLREEMLLTQEFVGGPTTISRNAFQAPGSDKDDKDSSADELSVFLEEHLVHADGLLPESLCATVPGLEVRTEPGAREKELLHRIAEVRHSAPAERIKADVKALLGPNKRSSARLPADSVHKEYPPLPPPAAVAAGSALRSPLKPSSLATAHKFPHPLTIHQPVDPPHRTSRSQSQKQKPAGKAAQNTVPKPAEAEPTAAENTVPKPEQAEPKAAENTVPKPEKAAKAAENTVPKPEQAEPKAAQPKPEQAEPKAAENTVPKPEKAAKAAENTVPKPEQAGPKAAKIRPPKPEQAEPKAAQPKPEQAEPKVAENTVPKPEKAAKAAENTVPKPEQADPKAAKIRPPKPEQAEPQAAQNTMPKPEQAEPKDAMIIPPPPEPAEPMNTMIMPPPPEP